MRYDMNFVINILRKGTSIFVKKNMITKYPYQIGSMSSEYFLLIW